MSESQISSAKASIKRLLNLEKLRTRRRTLKSLLFGSGVLTVGGVLHAQQNSAKNVVPAINLLLDEAQCPSAPVHEIPDDSGVTPGSEFILSANNYTGTASRNILVNSDNLTCPVLVTVTLSVCLEVESSTSDLAVVNIDPIAISEGLSALDEMNDDPAVDYFFRSKQPFSDEPDASTAAKRSLNELSINRESINSYTAYGGSRFGLDKSCGFMPSTLPFTLNIENNQPVLTVLERTVSVSVDFTFPKTKILLSADTCAHPDRFATSCSVNNDDSNGNNVGIVFLTTPDPDATGGPVG